MIEGFQYAMKAKMENENDYAYTAVTGTCAAKPAKGHINMSKFINVAANNSKQMVAALTLGPLSVAIEADTMAFQFYSGGILTDTSCGYQLDHGVLAVGYGTDATSGLYYIVKNSWGSSWGENGFIKISSSDKTTQGQGICGIQMEASLPTALN